MSMTRRYKFKLYDKNGIDLSESLFDMQRIALQFTRHKVRTTTKITDNANKWWVKTEKTYMRERKFEFRGTICWKTVEQSCIAKRKLQATFTPPWNPNCWEFFRIEWQDWCWDIDFWSRVKIFTPIEFRERTWSCLVDFSFCLISEQPEYYGLCQEKKAKIQQWCWLYFEPKPTLMETVTKQNFKWEFYEDVEKKAWRDNSKCCIVCNEWNYEGRMRILVKWNVTNLDIYNHTNNSRLWINGTTNDFVFDNTNILSQESQAVITDWWADIRNLKKKWTWLFLEPWDNCLTFEADIYDEDYEICLLRYNTYA